MTLEQVPLVVAVLFGVLALWLLADAVLPEGATSGVLAERRRRRRAERHRVGEGGLALGFAAFAVALVGGEPWRWGTVAMIVGGALVLAGLALNGRFLVEALAHRGSARRGRDTQRREATRPGAALADRRQEGEAAAHGPGAVSPSGGVVAPGSAAQAE